MATYYGYFAELVYPSGLRLYIDGTDITQFAFGSATITPTILMNKWKDIDLSTYVDIPGRHTLTITAETPGKVDTRIEISNEKGV